MQNYSLKLSFLIYNEIIKKKLNTVINYYEHNEKTIIINKKVEKGSCFALWVGAIVLYKLLLF